MKYNNKDEFKQFKFLYVFFFNFEVTKIHFSEKIYKFIIFKFNLKL